MKRICWIILFILSHQFVFSQIDGQYKSFCSDYFPTFLCLGKDTLNFCIIERIGGEHPENTYFEVGTYRLNGDTVFFEVDRTGFNPAALTKEKNLKMGLLKKRKIFFLNEKGECYLKLKKRNIRK